MPIIEKYLMKDLDGNVIMEFNSRSALDEQLSTIKEHIIIEKHVCNVTVMGLYNPKKKGFVIKQEV